MLQVLFKKWWVLLLQGILLIILSIYVFNNPVEVLAGISLWFGLLAIATGFIGVVAWFSADKAEREGLSLLWSIATVVFGIIMIKNLLATMLTVSVLFGIWMLFTGLLLTRLGWPIISKNTLGWVLVVAGVLSAIAGVMMIFNIGLSAIGISTIIGLQLLLTGLALIIFSFVKKSVVGNVKEGIGRIKSDFKNN